MRKTEEKRMQKKWECVLFFLQKRKKEPNENKQMEIIWSCFFILSLSCCQRWINEMLSAITYCLKQEIYKARDEQQNITKIGSTDTISNHQNYFKICTMCLCVSLKIMVIKRPLSVDLQENKNDMCTMGKWRKKLPNEWKWKSNHDQYRYHHHHHFSVYMTKTANAALWFTQI